MIVRRILLPLLLGFLALPVHAAETDRYLPNQTAAVVTVEIKQLLESPLLKDHIAALRDISKQIDVIQPVTECLGLDPFQDIDRIVLAFPPNPDGGGSLILLQGGFDSSKIQAGLDKAAKDANSKIGTTTIRDQTVHIFRTEPNPQTWLYILPLEKGMLAVATNQQPITELADIKAGKRKGELGREMQQLLAKHDPRHAISIAALSQPLNFGGLLGNIPGNLQNVTGGVVLGDDIKLELTLMARDIQTAKSVAGQLEDTLNQAKAIVAVAVTQQKQLSPLADLINGVRVAPRGSDVTFRLTISKEMIDMLRGKEP